MAKKKDLGISVDMLQSLGLQQEEESKKIRQSKEQRELKEELNREDYKYEFTRSRDIKNVSIKRFDRKRERPIQKTVHLTIEADNKVNMVKSMLKTLGKKTTFEDLLFDLLDQWLTENYDDILAGKLVYPGEKGRDK